MIFFERYAATEPDALHALPQSHIPRLFPLPPFLVTPRYVPVGGPPAFSLANTCDSQILAMLCYMNDVGLQVHLMYTDVTFNPFARDAAETVFASAA